MVLHLEKIQVETEAELWRWLDQNHQSSLSYLLVTWKKADLARYVSREQVLDALLAYGWIDGRRYALDEARTMQLICQRQQQKWTKTYRDRVDRLILSGRLKPSGLAVVDAAKANGTWLSGQDIDTLELPEDLHGALSASSGLDWWAGAAPSYRRNVLRWLSTAKTEKTRQKRCHEIAHACGAGQKIKNL